MLIIFSCSKAKFSSTPSLKFKSVNTTQLLPGGALHFTLTFTDAEGDFSDSGNVYIQFMQRTQPSCTINSNDETIPMPAIPKTKDQKGEINVSLDYNSISPQCAPLNDTTVFRFVLKDDAGHVSDTASSPTIIISN